MLMEVRLVFIVIISLLISCNKVETVDNSPYFTISSVKNGESIVDSVYSIPESNKWEMTNSFGKVSFSSLNFVVKDTDGEIHYINDDSMTEFFWGFEISPKWAWCVDSCFIESGKKYYCDTTLLAKHEYSNSASYEISSPKSLFMIYSPHTQNGSKEKVIWGWMSFTKNVDEPGIILRVDFEADVVVTQRITEKEDTIRYREGRIDFTTKMAGRIIGGYKLR